MAQTEMLNRILDSGDTSLITENNLNADYFSEYTAEFAYIKRFMDQYSKIPDMATFLNTFPDFPVLQTNEPNSFLLAELVDDKNRRFLTTTFNQIRDILVNNKPTAEGISLVQNAASACNTTTTLTAVDLIRDTSRFDRYEDKVNNVDKYFIKTGFDELDQIICGWDVNEELATIVARNGLGKCLEKGTKILMADGSTKKVEDVVVGDKVQSLGCVNTVQALHNGKSKGYKIIPKIGDPFTVSANHILTLMKAQTFWDKIKKQTSSENEFVLEDVTIEDYLKLNKSNRAKYRLYRPSVDYPEKTLRIPPYILGLWLGDGTACRPELTSMDPEIIKEWCDYAKSCDLQCTVHSQNGSQAASYDITSGSKRGPANRNIVKNYLDSYQLLNNKHIPLDYLTSSETQRLELLAGLIDTDGYFAGTLFEITTKNFELAQEIAQLARGLGFKVGHIKTRMIRQFVHYRVNFSGDLYRIPTRLVRKHCTQKVKNKPFNPSTTTFSVEEVPEIEYYGFMADGDHRYLLADNTLTHNTWILNKCLVAAAKQGKRAGLYSGEMSEDAVGYRIDTLATHISNGALVHGSGSVKNQYKHCLEQLQKDIPGSIFVITPASINGRPTVSALRAFIEKYQLDILFVDQNSLLEDERGAKNPVEQAANISTDLKFLQVTKHIPIICVNQQNREKIDNGTFDTTQVAQSDRIAQNSSCIIFLERKDDLLKLHLVKSRQSGCGNILTYRIDFNTGFFEYVPGENDKNSAEQVTEQMEMAGYTADEVIFS